jgi:hypothetical protein
MLVAVMLASVPALMHGQRSSGMLQAHGGAAIHPNPGIHTDRGQHSHGFVRSRDGGHARHQRDGYGFGVFPYFLPDYETGWPEPEQEEPAEQPSGPPLVRVHDETRDREPAPPLPAQVIEIPNNTKNIENKPLPATVFVLTNGEKLETQRYLLTANSVSLTLHRDQRTIPLQMLDLDATIAANRDRGIDLRIPNDRNEVSLRF